MDIVSSKHGIVSIRLDAKGHRPQSPVIATDNLLTHCFIHYILATRPGFARYQGLYWSVFPLYYGYIQINHALELLYLLKKPNQIPLR
jgi:hypothetical protein